MAFARNTFQTLVAQLVTAALAAVSGIVLTRLLRPGGKGVYALLQADINLLVLFFGLSLPGAIVFYTANRRLELSRLLTIALGVLGVGGMLAAGSLFLLRGTDLSDVFFPRTSGEVWFQAYVIVAFLLVSANATLSAVFQGQSAFRLVNTVSLLVAVANLTVYGACLYLDQRPGRFTDPIKVVLLASLTLYAATTFLWSVLYARYVGIHPTTPVPRQELEVLGRYLVVTHVANLMQFLNYQLDIWLVAYFWNEAELGYYSTAVGSGQLLWLISQPLAAVLLPYVSSRPEADGHAALALASRLCFSLTLVLAVAAFALAGVLVPLVYGSEFSPTVASLRLLLPGILIGSVTKILAAYIAARGLVRYNLLASAAGLAVTVTLDLLLIPGLGGRGAALATTGSYVCTWLCCVWTLVHVARAPLRHSFVITREDVERLRARLRRGGSLLA